MTLKKLRKVLEQEGVTPIDDPEGKLFDPSRHNAIAAVGTRRCCRMHSN